MITPSGAPMRNQLLASLPAEEQARVRQHIETMWLEQRAPVHRPGVPITHVYFPETAVISLVNTFQDGAAVEVGTTGCEGMVGLTLLLSNESPSTTAFAQIPGVVARMRADAFLELARAPGALHGVLLRYADVLLAQVAQTAACNATHLVQERCARWLLMTHDRAGADQFNLTQEFLAVMLGVRRPSVTVVAGTLHKAGLIDYGHKRITILDRKALEATSCECYRVVQAHFTRLLS